MRPSLLTLCLAFLTLNVFAQLKEGTVLVHANEPSQQFTFSPEQAKHHFVGSFINWAIEDIGNIPAPESTLLVGSSSVRFWRSAPTDLSSLNIIHRGFGGSTIHDVMLFKEFFARYQCNQIIVYEGDNDITGKTSTVESFIKDCKSFVAYIHEQKPETKIHFISPKPSPARWKIRENFSLARTQLQAFANETPNVEYIDVATPMLGEDGTPMPDIFKGDRLHMNDKGYAIWAKVILAHFGNE